MHSRLHFRFFFYILQMTLLISSALASQAIELTTEEKEYIKNSPVIRIHNETDWPPFNFFDNGKPQGISIDVMNRIATITGLKIKYITGPSWGEFTQMINSNELDLMLNIVDLPERRGQFNFTTLYAKSLSGIFTTNTRQQEFFSFDDLQGKTIAIPAGFDLEIKLPAHHPGIKLLPVRDILECIEAIHSGKADAFMEEIGVVDYIISQKMVSDIRLAFQVTDEEFISDLNIGVRKDDTLLYDIIQKGLNNISGEELNSIRKKWLLKVHDIYEQSMVNFSIEEKKYLFSNNKINICVDPTWAPLDFIDRNGNHSGLSADLIGKIATRAGIEINLIPTKTWKETLTNMRDGKCHVIPLMNETIDAKSYIDFSQPYFNFATVIATRKEASFIGDYSGLYGKKVALQNYFFITEYVKEHHPQIKIIEVENTQEALKLVSEKKAFATIDGLPTIVNTIETLALENIKIVGSVPQENQMKLGVRKGNSILLSILNKSLASLSEKEKIGLYKKWFDIEVSNQFFDRRFIVKTGIVTLVLLIFILWRHLTLSKYTGRLKVLNEKLKYIATIDHLTKAFNRRAIEKQLIVEIKHVTHTKKTLEKPHLSAVIFDIDHFKKVNDTYGHIIGDKVLRKVASVAKSSIRKDDLFGRWGGEEFLIILPNTPLKEAEKIITRLRKNIERHDFDIGKTVTASFGLGLLRKEDNSTTLLTRIDNYLYEAKEQGRNCVVTENPTKE